MTPVGATGSGSRRAFWIAWLRIVLALVLVYGLFLVFAGSSAESVFTAFGFGPPAAIRNAEVTDYLRLPFMVLGAVLVGWSLLMHQIVHGPLRAGEAWAWSAVVGSLAVWFVLDTGMSVVLGFPAHALFNVPFALVLGIPLGALRPTADRRQT